MLAFHLGHNFGDSLHRTFLPHTNQPRHVVLLALVAKSDLVLGIVDKVVDDRVAVLAIVYFVNPAFVNRVFDRLDVFVFAKLDKFFESVNVDRVFNLVHSILLKHKFFIRLLQNIRRMPFIIQLRLKSQFPELIINRL